MEELAARFLIKRLEMKNFRGFESAEVHFHPELTVLVGANGSGKTSVLEALAMFMSHGVHGSLNFRHLDKRRGHDDGSAAVDAYDFGETRTGVVDWASVRGPTVRSRMLEIKRWLNRTQVPVLCYYPVGRHATDATPGAKGSSRWGLESAWQDSLITGATTFQLFFNWFREREDVENQELRDNHEFRDPQLQAVRKAIVSLLPGFSEPRVRRPRADQGEFISGLNSPVLTLKKEGQELAFDQLSEGERTLAALISDIARRLAIANPGGDALKGSGVILIDEIELHLHPKWQELAIPALRRTFPNIQFIITTHSPLVLSHVKGESVRLLQNFEVFPAPGHTWGRDPSSLLTDVFGVALRPSEVQNALVEISKLIDAESLEEARVKIAQLSEQIGDDDAELIRLRGMVELLED